MAVNQHVAEQVERLEEAVGLHRVNPVGAREREPRLDALRLVVVDVPRDPCAGDGDAWESDMAKLTAGPVPSKP